MLQVATSVRMTSTALAVGMLAAVLLLPAAANAQDKNCSDFASQSQAQAFFESIGGSPSNNADNLDADHDGKACEELAAGSTSSTNGDLASTGFDAWKLVALGIGGLGLAGGLAWRARRLSYGTSE